MIDAALLLTASFFALYGVACGLECGVALALLTDGHPTRARHLFTPFWEVTNVFLVFGFTGLAVLFNGALQNLSHALISTLAVGLIGLLLRGCVVLRVFYVNDGKLTKTEAALFALCNYAIPLSFTAAGAYLLSGQLFWHTLLGWLIVAATILGLSALGLTFVESRNKRSPVNIVFAAWLLALGCLLPLSIEHSHSMLQLGPVAILSALSALGLFLLLIKIVWGGRKLVLAAGIVIGLAAPLLLAWANRPYLISGKLTLAHAYGAQAFGPIVVIGLGITLPVILLGGWLFYKLLKMPQNI